MPSATCPSPNCTLSANSTARGVQPDAPAHSPRLPERSTSASRRPTPSPSAAALARREMPATAQALWQSKIEYVPHASFASPPARQADRARDRRSARTMNEHEALSDAPLTFDDPERLLSRDEEVGLFFRMNYLKHRAEQLRARLNPRKPRPREVERIARLLTDAVAVRNRIVAANVRLVVSVAKNYVNAANTLGDLVSDGNMSLLRAVEKFDFSLGYRFSTYATWALRYNFNRAVAARRRRQQRFVSGEDHMLEAICDASPEITASSRRQLKQSLARLLGQLDVRERRIITFRFGLAGDASPATLAQLATKLGVCKERVRQLEMRALDKLRNLAASERLEPPD
jgi:RNA polymerase sigma factor (sigma-70 family)